MKKVLFVASVVKLHIMVFHLHFLEWFKNNGYEVHVAARNDYDNPIDCIIPNCDYFYDLPFDRTPLKYNNFKAYKMIETLLFQNTFEVIHCHTPVGGALTRMANLKFKNNKSVLIYTAHGFHFYNGAPIVNWLVYYPIEKFLSKSTDVLITINKEDYSRADKSFKAKHLLYIPGVGISIEDYMYTQINRHYKLKELGLPSDCFYMISVGELNSNKNHEIVIRTLAKVKYNDIHYIVCGQGELLDYLKKLRTKLKLENRVHFLGYRNDISEINAISDIFVFPSYREGLSVSLMEAMASGLPVICSNIRGNVDLIDNGKGGYLFNPNDNLALATIIEQFYCDSEKRRTFGDYNKLKVNEFSKQSILKLMSKVYQGLYR